MVVEADESDGSFLQYPAEVAVVTNVDPDHLSNWGTAEHYADGFLAFATGDGVRLLVVSADDPGRCADRPVRADRRPGGTVQVSPSASRLDADSRSRARPRRHRLEFPADYRSQWRTGRTRPSRAATTC